MNEYKNILVFGEIEDNKITPATGEVLAYARLLADQIGEKVFLFLVGEEAQTLAKEAITLGSDKVYAASNVFEDVPPEIQLFLLERLAKEIKPYIILMGQTSLGRAIAPRLALRLGTAACMDCVSLVFDPATKLLRQIKPVYGGNAHAAYSYSALPQIATLRSKVISATVNSSRSGEIVDFVVPELPSPAVKITKKVNEGPATKLEDASVIVAGGRGIGDVDGFKQLEKLANILNAAIGASRPPCENGWVPDRLQIGLTGKIVAPELYIAVGLSGSSQHLSGCSGSKNIIAINKDPQANIFREARFGVVGDWRKVLPAFTRKASELVK